MCGRYSLATEISTLEKHLGFRLPPGSVLKPRYNIAPSQEAPVVMQEGPSPSLKIMRWGLVPSWAKDPAIGNQMINARAETVSQKPSFRKPFLRQRCLVLADGFYEWRKVDARAKVPMRIVLKNREPFAMAGLWDVWMKPDGNNLHSFTIITTGANEMIRPIHERMPVILDWENKARWMDPTLSPEKLNQLLVPCESDLIDAYEVSRAVNIPQNDSPECIAPVR
jgi:putative SOS response-associated peptidase YedK